MYKTVTVIGATFIGVATISLVAGILADLIAANRSISADIRAHLLTAELARNAGIWSTESARGQLARRSSSI